MELLVGQEIKRPIEFHWDITALTIKGNSHSFRFYKKKKKIHQNNLFSKSAYSLEYSKIAF